MANRHCTLKSIILTAAAVLPSVACMASETTSAEPMIAAQTVASAVANCDTGYQADFGQRHVSADKMKTLAVELMGRWRFYSLNEPKQEPQGWDHRYQRCTPDVVGAALLLQDVLGRRLRPDADSQAVRYLGLIEMAAKSLGAADVRAAMNALDPTFRHDLERFGPLFADTDGSFANQAKFERLAADPAVMIFLKTAANNNASINPAVILAILSLGKTRGVRDLEQANNLLNQGRLKTQGPLGLVGQLRARLLSQPETIATTAPAAARAWNELATLGSRFVDAQIAAMNVVDMQLRRDRSLEGQKASLRISCALAMAQADTAEGSAALERARTVAAMLNSEKSLASLILTAADFHALGQTIPFNTDDYPARAMRNMAQGAVTVNVLIDGTGALLLAKRETSSGNSDLDDTTLRIWLKRMRTIPLPSQWQGKYAWVTLPRVNWRLPQDLLH